MHISTLIEVIAATHLSHYVLSTHPERSGLMLVGPPASLKSAMSEVLEVFPNARLLSDITIKQATHLRSSINGGRVITLGFSDFAKLYQRDANTAANIEGFVRAVVAEGFRTANWEDAELPVTPMRCCIIGAMTDEFHAQHFSKWKQDGFARRFIWAHVRLKDPELILQHIVAGTRIKMTHENGFNPRMPIGRDSIVGELKREESERLLQMISHQIGREMSLILLQKIYCVLRWKFKKEPSKVWYILNEFSEALGKTQAEIIVDKQ